MSGALCVAPCKRIPKKVRRTGALCSVVDGLTIGIFSTHTLLTGRDTPVGLSVTFLALAALTICVTLMSAALQWVSYKGGLAPTNGPVILSNLTVSILTTWSTNLSSGEASATPEGITSGSSWTPANGYMVLNTAVSSLSTCETAWVNTFIVLTGSLGPTVTVLITLTLNAPSVWVSMMTW